MPEAAVAPSSAPAVEEAAILYANDQLDVAELVLLASLQEAGRAERQPWWMLFDLYQARAANRIRKHRDRLRQPFRNLAAGLQGRHRRQAPGGSVLPSFPARSRPRPVRPARRHRRAPGARAGALVEPAGAPGIQAVSGATPQGCALLLHALQSLRRAGASWCWRAPPNWSRCCARCWSSATAAPPEAPWLLLLELLLLNREKDFEETAMDYCVTFEVSPPSFEAPAHAAVSVRANGTARRRPLPAAGRGRGDIAPLLHAIAMHAAHHPALVLDCSRLARIDYAGANALAVQLRSWPRTGATVALRDLNHLAAALLRLLGIGDPRTPAYP
jgi:ABC-type transporter Mla MlaB component